MTLDEAFKEFGKCDMKKESDDMLKELLLNPILASVCISKGTNCISDVLLGIGIGRRQISEFQIKDKINDSITKTNN